MIKNINFVLTFEFIFACGEFITKILLTQGRGHDVLRVTQLLVFFRSISSKHFQTLSSNFFQKLMKRGAECKSQYSFFKKTQRLLPIFLKKYSKHTSKSICRINSQLNFWLDEKKVFSTRAILYHKYWVMFCDVLWLSK